MEKTRKTAKNAQEKCKGIRHFWAKNTSRNCFNCNQFKELARKLHGKNRAKSVQEWLQVKLKVGMILAWQKSCQLDFCRD